MQQSTSIGNLVLNKKYVVNKCDDRIEIDVDAESDSGFVGETVKIKPGDKLYFSGILCGVKYKGTNYHPIKLLQWQEDHIRSKRNIDVEFNSVAECILVSRAIFFDQVT